MNYKHLLDEVFVTSPTETLIILEITKAESNNCFTIHRAEKMEAMFLLLH